MLHILFICLCLLCSCSSGNDSTSDVNRWMTSNGKIKILSTIAMIDDLVKGVGGEHVEALSLIKGDLDPHTYQLVKGDDEKLNRADLIFYNGLHLEHGPSLQRYLFQNQKAISLGNQLHRAYPKLIILEKGQIDPHVWMDISLWAKTVPFIVEALSKKDPIHASYYQKNGNDLINTMQKVHQEVKATLEKVPEEKRFLVTSHDAFNYFGRAYLATENESHSDQWRKRVAAPEGLSPDSQLGASDIQLIIDHLKKYNIHVLFPESNVSKDSIKKIALAGKENGLDLHIASTSLYADAMGAPGTPGDSYLKMIRFDASAFVNSVMSGENGK